jgi:hypothetical protein
MCGFTAKAYEIVHGATRVPAPDVLGDLWYIAARRDMLEMYQDGAAGRRCAEMYERASELTGSGSADYLFGNVLRKASTHFAQPEGVSVETRQVEWAVNSTDRGLRAQHKWRFLDATRMQGGLLREGVREAFEAIWMAGEWPAAYEYIDTLTLNLDMLQRED